MYKFSYQGTLANTSRTQDYEFILSHGEIASKQQSQIYKLAQEQPITK